MTPKETVARADVMHDHYAGIVEMAAQCMIDMIKQHVIPSAKAGGYPELGELEGLEAQLKAKLSEMHEAEEPQAKATIARVLRLEVMESVRQACDKTEAALPASV